MKKIAAVVIFIAFSTGLFFVFKSNRSASENPAGGTRPPTFSESTPTASVAPRDPASVPTVSPAVAVAILTNNLTAQAASPKLAPLDISSLPPLTVLDNARVAMKNYGTTFGENPVGTNPEITAALMGKNPKQINFITAESGLRVNEQGEMVDAYGTPFFFHQLSGQEMEIRSAGQDRKLWTFDDLITR